MKLHLVVGLHLFTLLEEMVSKKSSSGENTFIDPYGRKGIRKIIWNYIGPSERKGSKETIWTYIWWGWSNFIENSGRKGKQEIILNYFYWGWSTL